MYVSANEVSICFALVHKRNAYAVFELWQELINHMEKNPESF